MHPKDSDGIAKSDCSSRSSLIWVCTICPDQSVRKLRINTVSSEVTKVFRVLRNEMWYTWMILAAHNKGAVCDCADANAVSMPFSFADLSSKFSQCSAHENIHVHVSSF